LRNIALEKSAYIVTKGFPECLNQNGWMEFDKLYRQNYLLVFRLAKKIVLDEDTSRDIAQEIFCRLHLSLNKGVQIIKPDHWLCRITVNYCYNHLRDHKKNGKAVGIYKEIEEIVDEQEQTDSGTLRQEETDLIRNMMLRLSEKERLMLTLYSEEMSYKEIAEIAGIPFPSVGKTLSRSLLKLKKLCHEI